MTEEHLKKVESDELRDLVRTKADGLMEVLIELDLPVSRPWLRDRWPRASRVPYGPIDSGAPPNEVAIQSKIAEARRMIAEVTGVEPIWIGAANVMVAELTGEQLARVTASPLIRRIYPNRTLRRSTASNAPLLGATSRTNA